MRFLFILFLPFFLFSCVVDVDVPREGRRDLNTQQRERSRPEKDLPVVETPAEPSIENEDSVAEQEDKEIADNAPSVKSPDYFVLPIRLLDSETSISLHSNKARTHVIIKTEPADKGLKIIAGLAGVVSIDENSLSITSKEEAKIMLELDMENTSFSVEDGETVQVKQILGETIQTITVTLKKENQLIPLCLKITNRTKNGTTVTITKEPSLNDPCESN